MSDDLFEQLLARLRSPDENERVAAIQGLLELKDRRAVDLMPPLVELEHVGEVRFQARRAYYLLRDVVPDDPELPFLALPDGIAIDDLLRLLQDENPRLRTEGVKLAERVEPGTIAAVLRTIVAKEPLPQLQAAMLGILGRVGNRNDIPIVAAFLEHDDHVMRVKAIEALAAMHETDALEYIVPHYQDPDKDVREATAKVFQARGSAELLKVLRSMSTSTNDAWRDAAIFTLQRFKTPVAAKILAFMAAEEPQPELRAKARTGLELMAKGDDTARQLVQALVAEEERRAAEDAVFAAAAAAQAGGGGATPAAGQPGAPGTPAAGVPAAGAAPVPKLDIMVVPGLPPRLVREISKGDQATREAGLKQLAPLLKPEHVPFLLHRLEADEDPRIISHLLILLGKTHDLNVYATVVKYYKHPDDRVRANAIEAAQMIDPDTTPDRVVGFLKDANNRVKANSIIVCASRPDFDPLPFVRDLAENHEAGPRRSALYVINKLKNPTFLDVLAYLLEDCEMEIRHLAFIALKDFVTRDVAGARELAETAGKKLAREQSAAGKYDQDFHAAMNAMRAPPAPKKRKPLPGKSAGQELAEQFLGEGGIKQAGQSIKDMQAKAKEAREKMTAKMAEVNWSEKLVWVGGIVGLVAVVILHIYTITQHLHFDAAIHFAHLGCAGLALLAAAALVRSRPGVAALLGLVLFAAPFVAKMAGILEPAPLATAGLAPESGSGHGGGSGRGSRGGSGSHSGPGSARVGTGGSGSGGASPGQGSGSGAASSGKSPATAVGKPEGPAPTVKLLAPTKNATIPEGEFVIKARVTGKPATIGFFLDDKNLETRDEKKPGTYEYKATRTPEHRSGFHVIEVRVTDIYDRKADDAVRVRFPGAPPEINVSVPASGGALWRDDRLVVTLQGAEEREVEFLLDDVLLQTFMADPSRRYEYPISIATMTEGPHRFSVRVALIDEGQASVTVPFKKLTPKPTVRFAGIKDGDEVFGMLNFTIEADSGWRETPVRSVAWYTDGQLRQTLASPPWQGSWDLVDEEIGPHELKAVLINELGATAETVVKFNVIKPQFSATIKGIKPNQVLTDDLSGTVEVMNEFPGTTIKKVVTRIDDTVLHEATQAPCSFTIRVFDVAPGARKLEAEATRSDGKTTKTVVPFSTNPRGRVSVYFTAHDVDGSTVQYKELAGLGLQIAEDGRSVGSFTLQSAETLPDRFGLLVCVPGSMKSDKRMAKAKEGASAFLDGMKPGDQAFLLKFADTPSLVLDFTDDKRKVQQELEFLTPQGAGISLYNAIYQGIDRGGRGSGRTVLVVLTDLSVDQSGRGGRSARDTLDFAKKNDVQIFAIGLGRAPASSLADIPAELTGLARATGGDYFAAASAADLPHVYRTILKAVRAQARASFKSPSGGADGSWHTIAISCPAHPELTFKAKTGFHGQ